MVLKRTHIHKAICLALSFVLVLCSLSIAPCDANADTGSSTSRNSGQKAQLAGAKNTAKKSKKPTGKTSKKATKKPSRKSAKTAKKPSKKSTKASKKKKTVVNPLLNYAGEQKLGRKGKKRYGTITVSRVQKLFNGMVGNRRLGRFYNGKCLEFISKTWLSKLDTSSFYSWCCARTYAGMVLQSKSMDDIPIGADVFFTGSSIGCGACGKRAGHVGIYVGDGYIVHAWGRNIRKDKIVDIPKIDPHHKYLGWGYHGGVNVVPDKGNHPTGALESVEVRNGSIFVSGWAYDKDSLSKSLKVNIFIGSPSAGGKKYTIKANKGDMELNAQKKISGKHRFKATIKIKLKGKKKIYAYALNVKSGNDSLIGTKTVKSPLKSKSKK